jgi:hypothetical protein
MSLSKRYYEEKYDLSRLMFCPKCKRGFISPDIMCNSYCPDCDTDKPLVGFALFYLLTKPNYSEPELTGRIAKS